MYVANYFLQGEVTHSGLPQWLSEQTGLHGSDPEAVQLVIWINSNGGDVLAAIESINLIKSSPIPVVTIINGCAESAALLIAMAGHRRLIFESSWGMAHHFSTAMEGNYHELIDSVKHNNLLHHLMMDLFKKHSKLSEKEIDAKLLGRKHTWLDANELKKMGLVDEIIKPGPGLMRRILSNGSQEKTSRDRKKPV